MSTPLNLNELHRPAQAGPLFGAGRYARPVVTAEIDEEEPLFAALVLERGYTPAGHPHRDQEQPAAAPAAADPAPPALAVVSA